MQQPTQRIVAPHLRRPVHKLPRTPGEYIAAAREAAPLIYAKRTDEFKRQESTAVVCRALRSLLYRANRIWKVQCRPMTDAEATLFGDAKRMSESVNWCWVMAENTPDSRATVKAEVDHAMRTIDALESYRGDTNAPTTAAQD